MNAWYAIKNIIRRESFLEEDLTAKGRGQDVFQLLESYERKGLAQELRYVLKVQTIK